MLIYFFSQSLVPWPIDSGGLKLWCVNTKTCLASIQTGEADPGYQRKGDLKFWNRTQQNHTKSQTAPWNDIILNEFFFLKHIVLLRFIYLDKPCTWPSRKFKVQLELVASLQGSKLPVWPVWTEQVTLSFSLISWKITASSLHVQGALMLGNSSYDGWKLFFVFDCISSVDPLISCWISLALAISKALAIIRIVAPNNYDSWTSFSHSNFYLRD